MSVTTVLTSQHSITSQKTRIFIYTAVRPHIVIHYHDHTSQPWIPFWGVWIHIHRWNTVNKMIILTLCHQVTYEDTAAMPFIVNGSHILTFHTQHPYMHFSDILYHNVKVINTMKQDVWVSSHKHADRSWPHILRTVWLQHSDHRFRYPLYCLLSLSSAQTMVLCRSVMTDDDILWELHVDIYILMFDDCEAESLGSTLCPQKSSM
jgi:hypothetical protein